MKNNALYVLIAVVLLCSVGVTILFVDKVAYLDSRIDQAISISENLNKNFREDKLNMVNIGELQNRIKMLGIEKESYSEMLDRESDWFIAYVSLLFAILAIMGFGVFRYELGIIRKDTEKNNIEQNNKTKNHMDMVDIKINEFKDEYLKFKKDTYVEIGNFESFLSVSLKDVHQGQAFISALMAASFSYGAYVIDANSNTKVKILSHLETTIKRLLGISKLKERKPEMIEYLKTNNDWVLVMLSEFLSQKDVELQRLCSEINVLFTQLRDGRI